MSLETAFLLAGVTFFLGTISGAALVLLTERWP